MCASTIEHVFLFVFNENGIQFAENGYGVELLEKPESLSNKGYVLKSIYYLLVQLQLHMLYMQCTSKCVSVCIYIGLYLYKCCLVQVKHQPTCIEKTNNTNSYEYRIRSFSDSFRFNLKHTFVLLFPFFLLLVQSTKCFSFFSSFV